MSNFPDIPLRQQITFCFWWDDNDIDDDICFILEQHVNLDY